MIYLDPSAANPPLIVVSPAPPSPEALAEALARYGWVEAEPKVLEDAK